MPEFRHIQCQGRSGPPCCPRRAWALATPSGLWWTITGSEASVGGFSRDF